LDSIRFNWMQLDWKTLFSIQNFELNSIHNVCVLCTEKANIIFRLKNIKIYNSYKWIKMHSGLKNILIFNISENIIEYFRNQYFWIHFNSFQSILVYWDWIPATNKNSYTIYIYIVDLWSQYNNPEEYEKEIYVNQEKPLRRKFYYGLMVS